MVQNWNPIPNYVSNLNTRWNEAILKGLENVLYLGHAGVDMTVKRVSSQTYSTRGAFNSDRKNNVECVEHKIKFTHAVLFSIP